MELIGKNRCFSGEVRRYRHASTALKCDMQFSVFLPPQAELESVPVLYWLSGLTCTDENFFHKAGAFQTAAKMGIAIVACDTSPRGEGIADDADSYDLGMGAGFYLNATQAPWAEHYRMHDYVVSELPELVENALPLGPARFISGHSMGGHGALICALKHPDRYLSVSAFAPIVNPMQVPWGQKAFTAYLGDDKVAWREYDACELVAQCQKHLPILVDQGSDDQFLKEQLQPDALQTAFAQAEYPMQFRMQLGYDHSYYFISTFIADHLEHHLGALK